MHRRLMSSIIVLEIYAAVLTCLQLPAGIRTDEAKYLLNIPYPHPPLFRFLLSTLLAVPFQELILRFLIASVVVQCAWLIWDMAIVLQRERKVALVVAWLFSAPVILQAGTIMTVVPTALLGLLFTWLTLDQRDWKSSATPLTTLLWLLALFTAYQSILFAPLVYAILRKMHCSPKKALALLALPIALLVLYTLTNPLALSTIMKVTSQDAVLSPLRRIEGIASVWMLSGGLLTVLGLYGVVVSGRTDLRLTMALLLAFTALTAQEYYALLLLPLLIAGLFILFCRRRASVPIFLAGHLLSTLILLSLHPMQFSPSQSRAAIPFLRAQGVTGMILIDGFFGHEWQYESPLPIGRFTQNLAVRVEDKAGAIVCTKKTCEDDIDHEKWVRLEGAPMEMWVRR